MCFMIHEILKLRTSLFTIAIVVITWNRHLTMRWPNMEPSCWSQVDPKSKDAFGHCGMPTLGQESK